MLYSKEFILSLRRGGIDFSAIRVRILNDIASGLCGLPDYRIALETELEWKTGEGDRVLTRLRDRLKMDTAFFASTGESLTKEIAGVDDDIAAGKDYPSIEWKPVHYKEKPPVPAEG